jgi:hypothetical protein
MTASIHRTSPLSHSRPRAPHDRALDADRTASMADEGGSAGAAMDLREQLAAAHDVVAPRRRPQSYGLWWGAAGAALGVAVALVLSRARTRV